MLQLGQTQKHCRVLQLNQKAGVAAKPNAETLTGVTAKPNAETWEGVTAKLNAETLSGVTIKPKSGCRS